MRSGLAIVLVVVGCLLTPLALLGMTLRSEILNVDDFVALTAPLAEDPAIQQAITAELGPEISGLVDGLAPGLVTAVQVEGVLTSIFQSDSFRTVWETVLRDAHPQIEQVLLGRDTDVLQTSDGRVLVDLTAIGRQVQQRLVADGVDIAGSIILGDTDLTVTLYHSTALAEVQEANDQIVRLAPIVAIVAVAALVLAVVIAPRRGRVIWWAGLGLLAGSLVVGALSALGRLRYLARIDRLVPEDAAEAAYEILVHPFVVRIRWWFVIALAILVIGAFLSPGRRGDRRAAGWLTANRVDLAGLAVAVGLGVLVWWHHPTRLVVITVAVAVVVAVLAVAVLGRRRSPSTT